MPSKQKPSNALNDDAQFKPLGKISGRGKGWKKYVQSNAVKAGLAGVGVLLLVLIIAWQLFSGGGESRPTGTAAPSEPAQAQATPSPPPMPQAPETAQATPEQRNTSADQNAQAGQENNPDQAAGSQAEEANPEQSQSVEGRAGHPREMPPGTENPPSPIPEDITKWSKADFLQARQQNHPKLLDAVEYLGEKFPGSVPVAQQLADLLKTPNPAEIADLGHRAPANAVQGLIETIIVALGKNGSEAAHQTLRQVLNGKLTIDDDRSAVLAVLKTLIQMPSAENDDVFVKVLISPDDIRPAGQLGTLQSSELRMLALDLVRESIPENLSIKLAQNAVQKALESNDPVMDLLLQDNPAYLGAQLVLYQSEDLSPDIKIHLEQYFQKYSSQAVGLTMGIPIGLDASSPMNDSRGSMQMGHGRRGQPQNPYPPIVSSAPSDASRDKILDYDRGIQLAKVLWDVPLASVMSYRLDSVRSLDKSTQEIVLASTLPLDSIHAAMFKMLKKRASDGPQPLESAGWTDRVLTDPGLLVLLKMLPRSRTIKGASITGAASTTQTSRYPARIPSGTDAGGPLGQTTKAAAAQRKEQADSEWLMTLSKMVDSWCNRLETASQTQKRAARRGLKVVETPPTRLDEFELPQEAKVTAAYQLNWPEKLPGDMGKVKPGTLKIQYFRLQLTGTFKKTMINFKRLAKGGDIHEMKNGQWLEMIKNGSPPNTKRSLDILVTSTGADNQQPIDFTLKEEPIDLQVDILTVEITDPSKE